MRRQNRPPTWFKYVNCVFKNILYTKKYRSETATYIIGLPIQRKYFNSEDLTLHKIKGLAHDDQREQQMMNNGGLAYDERKGTTKGSSKQCITGDAERDL
jgi:hypothetical protein